MSDENTEVSVGDDVVLDIPDGEAKIAPAEEVATEEVKQEDASTESEEKAEKPDKSRFQKRIDDLTAKVHAKEREAEQWKQKALSSEGTRKELAEHEAEKAESALAAVNAEAWQAKVEAAKEEYDDYEEVVSKSKAHVEAHVGAAVLESDIGPAIFRHLALNPEVLEKLNGMSEKSAIREIGKIEAVLEKNEKTAPPVKKVSTAPEPVKSVKSSQGVVQKALHEMSQSEYEAYRRKQGARW